MRNLLISLLLLALALPAAANESTAIQDRETALRTAHSIDVMDASQGLMELTVAGQTSEVLKLLKDTGARADWPMPARERALYGYTQQLRELPSDQVSPQVMAWLKSWEAQTLVPHDDHPLAGVPLFNIRGAAHGVENIWRHQDATVEGQALMASNPRSLVDAFLLEGHPAARSGYMEALNQASLTQLHGVGMHTARRLARQPELTGLGGRAALLSGDVDLLEQIFVEGEGPELSHLMRQSATRFSPVDNAALLEATLAAGPTLNASLAIAELTPAAAGVPGTQDLLLDQLQDPELGSSAALALSNHASTETLAALHEIAGGDNALAAARAQLAIDLSPLGERRGELR